MIKIHFRTHLIFFHLSPMVFNFKKVHFVWMFVNIYGMKVMRNEAWLFQFIRHKIEQKEDIYYIILKPFFYIFYRMKMSAITQVRSIYRTKKSFYFILFYLFSRATKNRQLPLHYNFFGPCVSFAQCVNGYNRA